MSDFFKIDGCDLCEAVRLTEWFHEDDICWIAECEICAVPMAVWRFHGIEPPEEHRNRARDDRDFQKNDPRGAARAERGGGQHLAEPLVVDPGSILSKRIRID